MSKRVFVQTPPVKFAQAFIDFCPDDYPDCPGGVMVESYGGTLGDWIKHRMDGEVSHWANLEATCADIPVITDRLLYEVREYIIETLQHRLYLECEPSNEGLVSEDAYTNG